MNDARPHDQSFVHAPAGSQANSSPGAGSARLTREDYTREPVALAQQLLGCSLIRTLETGERLAGVIVETEAYLGVQDKAAHSYNRRRTARNASMYAIAGTAYVYFTYGMHHCMNVVCGAEDDPVAVLLRALEPTAGLETMRRHRAARRASAVERPQELCSGPGKLCQALAIDRALDGLDLTRDARLFIEPPPRDRTRTPIRRTPRIGISSAGEWVERPLRFFLANSSHVSRN